MKITIVAALALAAITGSVYAENQMLAQSKVFHFADAATRKFDNGGGAHDMVLGVLSTGEAVRVHESMQPEGAVPNPSHAIEHSEFIVVQEGTLEYLHDGKIETAGPGDVIFVAFGTNHQIRNVGKGPVKYAIFSIGGDIKPKE